MSAIRGVVHVGIWLGPILIDGVSTLLSRRLDGFDQGSLLEMRVCFPCFDCFSTEQDKNPYTAQLVNVKPYRPNRPVLTHLAPMTDVFPRNIPRSIIKYAAAGRVDKARFKGCVSYYKSQICNGTQENTRPMNIAAVRSVPCSASKRSSNGANAIVLRRAWKKPRCMRG